MGGVFINYRVKDSALGAAAIADFLSRRFGAEQVFRDCVNMRPGESYPDQLRAGLEAADVLVAVIGPDWLTVTDDDGTRRIDVPGDWVRFEIRRAFERGLPVVPLFLDTDPLPVTELPADIRQLGLTQGMSVRNVTFGPDLDRLRDWLVDKAPTLVIPKLFVRPPAARPATAVPSSVLRSEYGVVPFTGRDEVLADLLAWAVDSAACSVQVVTGPSGMGKTRLARQLCAKLADRDWLAGIVHGQAPAMEIRDTAAIDKPMLVVVDDVEIRMNQIVALAHAVADRADKRATPTRLLLLASSAGDWLLPLRRHAEPRVRELFATLTGPPVALTASRPFLRQQYELARSCYAAELDRPVPAAAPPDGSASVLDAHAAALAEVVGGGRPAPDAVLPRLLRLDRTHLWRLARADGTIALEIADLGAIATLATLCRPDSADAADALVHRLPDLTGLPEAVVAQHVAWLAVAHPGPYSVNAVRPDALGAQLVAATLLARPSIATTLAANATDDQITAAMVVLGRALRRHPELRTALLDMSRVAPERMLGLSMTVVAALGDSEPFGEVLSIIIAENGLGTMGIEAMDHVSRLGTSGDVVKATVLDKFLDVATAPIVAMTKDAATNLSPALTSLPDVLTQLLMGTAKSFIDPKHNEMPTLPDGRPFVSPTLLQLLRQFMDDNGSGGRSG
ncbi:MAG TPA: toll/interleukin-1 receptor domain-containing protein [Pseudonocardiaceae bacterium]|nr:toll/interleukin-1 receptor domain-containing protein [Pseudonocardiaceae bacterium]